MYWEEENIQEDSQIVSEYVDVIFNVKCSRIAADHAYDLLQALNKKIPNIAEIENLSINSIHGAMSGAGWQRPDNEIYLSKRTKFILRMPRQFADNFRVLDNSYLKVGEYDVYLDKFHIKDLMPYDTLFCRYLIIDENEAEESIQYRLYKYCNDKLCFKIKKMMCGKKHLVVTPEKTFKTTTLLITELEPEQSIAILENGFGIGKLFGCGIFLPYKSIAPVAVKN